MAFDPVAFSATFPEFANTDTDQITAWANLVENSPQQAWFDSATLTDQQLMVAHVGHLLTQAATGSGGGGGAVISAGQGSVNVGFAAPPIKTGLEYYLSGSVYGQMLWANLGIASAGGYYVGGLPERRAFRKVGGVFG